MFYELFLQTPEHKKLIGALSGKGASSLFGLPGAGRAQVYTALARELEPLPREERYKTLNY